MPPEIIENVIPVAIRLLILLVPIYSIPPVITEALIPVAIKLLILLVSIYSVFPVKTFESNKLTPSL